jgi:hypothetical protein
MNTTLSTSGIASKCYSKTIPTALGRTVVFAISASDVPSGIKTQLVQAGLNPDYLAPENELIVGEAKVVSSKSASGIGYALRDEVNIAELIRLNISTGLPQAQSEARLRDKELRSEQLKAEEALLKLVSSQVNEFAAHLKNPRFKSVTWLEVYVRQLRERLTALETKSS